MDSLKIKLKVVDSEYSEALREIEGECLRAKHESSMKLKVLEENHSRQLSLKFLECQDLINKAHNDMVKWIDGVDFKVAFHVCTKTKKMDQFGF